MLAQSDNLPGRQKRRPSGFAAPIRSWAAGAESLDVQPQSLPCLDEPEPGTAPCEPRPMPRAPDLGWQERLQAARLALRTAGLAAAAVSVSPPGQPEAAVALAALEDAAAALRARLSELASLAGSTSGAEDRAALQAVLTDAEQLVKTRDRLRQRLLTAGREAAAAAPAVNTALLLRKPQPAAEAAAGLENPPQPAAAPAPEGTASHIAQRLAQMAEEREGLQEQRRKGWWRG